MNELNPYEHSPSVENEEHTQVVLRDADVVAPMSMTSTRVFVDSLGRRRAMTTQTIEKTDDGRIIQSGEQLYTCVNGCRRSRLTADSVVLCSRCHLPVCYSCLRIADISGVPHEVCPACVPRGLLLIIKKLFAWLLT